MGKRPAVSLRGLRKAGVFLLDLFFERIECPVCRGESKGLCGVCLHAMEEWGAYSHAGIPGQAMLHYSGAVSRLIYAYKKRRSLEARRALGLVMDRWLSHHDLNFDLIIPMTSTRASVKKRGFDPALSLGRMLSIRTGIPLVNSLKNEGTGENKARDYRERKEQAGLAIRLQLPDNITLKGRRILVFDDIMTTGATVEAAVERIRAEGADEVAFLVIARSTA